MKIRILKIAFAALPLLLLASCLKDRRKVEPDAVPATTASLVVSLSTASSEYEDDVEINKVRIIMFDNASTAPVMDVNKLYELTDSDRKTDKFKAKIEVAANPDKMAVVIVNEPAALTSRLSGTLQYSYLESLQFTLASVLNANDTEIAVSGMPMTGVYRNIEVTEANTPENPKVVNNMIIERALAKVELWLKLEDGAVGSISSASSGKTTITLKNTYTHGYLAAGTNANGTRDQNDITKDFGKVLDTSDISTFTSSTWTASANRDLSTTALLICSFFTPERNYIGGAVETDLLGLELANIVKNGSPAGASCVISEAYDENNALTTLTGIRRNNLYKVIGTVKNDGPLPINFVVVSMIDWDKQDVKID